MSGLYHSFKYISCYSLSKSTGAITEVEKFKYISCYSLSKYDVFQECWYTDLNTSHVILYHVHIQRNASRRQNLNTSHVILYLIPLVVNQPKSIYLNTSHVILYLVKHTPLLKPCIVAQLSRQKSKIFIMN